jgi:hypothetical protein
LTSEKLVVEMGGDGNSARTQTYSLSGKAAYVHPGESFKAEVSILAGAPARLANLAAFLGRNYDPAVDLRAPNGVDRYAAVKALPHREDLRERAVPWLEELLTSEPDERVALEAAGAAATLGSSAGQERIEAALWGDGRADLRMEAVLILTELGSAFAKRELKRIAGDSRFVGDEIRQAPSATANCAQLLKASRREPTGWPAAPLNSGWNCRRKADIFGKAVAGC